MSAPLGGASFDLTVSLQEFRQQLSDARALALREAQEIARILQGASGSQAGAATQQTDAATAAADRLTAAITALEAAVTGLAAAQGLSVQQIAAATAATAGQATATAALATAETDATAAIGANATAQAAVTQATVARAAAAKDLIAVQRALVNAEQAAGRTSGEGAGVEAGAAQAVETYERTAAALRLLEQNNPARAVREMDTAIRAARSALADLNDEFRDLLSGSGGSITGGGAEAEMQRLQELGQEIPTDLFNRYTAELEGATSAEDAEAAAMGRVIAQARTLTTVWSQLDAVRRNLTKSEQEGLTTEQRAAQRQADRAAEDAAKLAERLRLTTPGQALGDPIVQQTAQATEALKALGYSAESSRRIVDNLSSSLTAVGGSLKIEGVTAGLRQAQEASDALNRSLAHFGQGDAVRGFEELTRSVRLFEEALVETRLVQSQLNDTLRARPDDKAALDALNVVNQRERALSQSVRTAKTAIEEMGSVEQAAQRATKEHAGFLQTLSTAIQNIFGAIGLGPAGRFAGGTGRAASALEVLGITAETGPALAMVAAVTALTGALIEGTKAGIAYDAFLQVAQVHLEATGLSAAQAAEELGHLQEQARGVEFGAFSTEKLENASSILKRMGFEGDDMLRRVSDAAAASGQTISEAAQRIGAIYQLVARGQPFGEQLLSLQHAGIITSEYAAALRAATASGATLAEKTAILDAAFAKFEGTAERMGKTLPGAFQRAQNAGQELLGLALAPAFVQLAAAMTQLADVVASPGARAVANFFGFMVGIDVAPLMVTVQAIKLLSAAVADLSAHLGPVPKLIDDLNKSGGLAKLAGDLSSFILLGPGLGGITNALKTAYEELDKIRGVKPPVEQRQQDDARLKAITQDRFDATAAAYTAGTEAVAAFVRGFDETSQEAFTKIDDLIEGHLKALGGGKVDDSAMKEFVATIEPALGTVIDQIQRLGEVSPEALQALQQSLGVSGEAVMHLVGQFEELRHAINNVAAAQLAVDATKLNFDYLTDVARDIAAIDQRAIDDAENTKKRNHDRFEQDIADQEKLKEGFEATLQSAQDARKAHQEGAQAAIRGLQRDLEDYQAAIDARRQQAAATIREQQQAVESLQASLQTIQDQTAQHADAYQAVLAGTVEYFNAEHLQQDDITRAIVTKWDAEIAGLRRAKSEADDRVREQTENEHRLALAYDLRAQAARRAGNEGAARGIERERDRVIAAARVAGTVDRDRAAVAGDALTDRTTDVERAAAGQASADQRRVNAAQGLVAAAQDLVKATQEREDALQRVEDAEVARRQADIAFRQRKAEDQDNADQRAIAAAERDVTYAKAKIDTIKDQQKAQEILDQHALDDAKLIKAADDAYFKDRLANAQKDLDAANNHLHVMQQQSTEIGNQITAYIALNKELDQRLERELALLNLLREAMGLPPRTTSDFLHPAPIGEPGVGPSLDTQQYPDPPRGGTPIGGPEPPDSRTPRTYQYVLDPATYPERPPDFHDEYSRAGKKYWVANGFSLQQFPEYYEDLPGAGATTGPSAGSLAVPSPDSIGGGPTLYALRAPTATSAVGGPGAGAGAGGGDVHIAIGTVNASDPADVDAMLAQIEDRLWGSGLVSFESARRGGLVNSRVRA